MKKRRTLLTVTLIMGFVLSGALLVPRTAAAQECMTLPDSQVVNPGQNCPSYCGPGGDGCTVCYETIVVVAKP